MISKLYYIWLTLNPSESEDEAIEVMKNSKEPSYFTEFEYHDNLKHYYAIRQNLIEEIHDRIVMDHYDPLGILEEIVLIGIKESFEDELKIFKSKYSLSRQIAEVE